MDSSEQADRVTALVEMIKPFLAGEAAAVQGAALADLLSIWLAGHIVPGDPAATKLMHDELLQFHINGVRELIPVSAAQLHGGRQQ
jgi:hypothetical protein